MIENNMFLKSFFIILAVRVFSVFIVSTSYVPDEYWQSLEVAHKLAFGYGYLTWEWEVGIRSYMYPGLISLLYKLTKKMEIDTVENVTLLPRLFQAILSTVADLTFIRWCTKYIANCGNWALINVCVSWFHAYTATRTLTNSVEESLTTVALCLYPWRAVKQERGSESVKYLWFVGLACVIRPTAAVVWFPFVVFQMFHNSNRKYLIWQYVKTIIVCLLLSLAVDTLLYGRLVFSPFSFLYYNFVKNIGSFYGTHSLLWYFTTGVPGLLGIHVFPFLFGCWQVIRQQHSKASAVEKILLLSIFSTLLVYSLIPHKEFRFILPLFPMMLFIATSWLAGWERKGIGVCSASVIKLFLIVGSILPFLYCGTVHQRGTLDVMKVLGKEVRSDTRNASFLFLMPCHSTPLYSHLHRNVTTYFLKCDPTADEDEADIFFLDPNKWLDSKFEESFKMTSHVIMFNTLYNKIDKFLSDNGYTLFEMLFHTHFPSDNVGTHVLVFKRHL